MSDAAKWTAIGAMVAVVIAGAAVAGVETWQGNKRPAGPSVAMARIGPDGTWKSYFKEDQKNVTIPNSQDYDFCIGDLRVQRPSMMTTDMPDSYCTVTRQKKGGWQVSTGGWQRCQALCFRTAGRKG